MFMHQETFISATDLRTVKKWRPWWDTALETWRLVWVYTFNRCRKAPLRLTLVIMLLRLGFNM